MTIVEQIEHPSLAKLDRIDIKILIHLQQDSGVTNLELSESVALSPSACLQRVRRLEKAGIIKRYGAEVDWKRVHSQIRVFTRITLKSHGVADFQQFERYVRNHPEIVQCFALCGDADYLLQFVCKDMAAYQDSSDALISAGVAIANISSYAVMREIKTQPAMLKSDELIALAG